MNRASTCRSLTVRIGHGYHTHSIGIISLIHSYKQAIIIPTIDRQSITFQPKKRGYPHPTHVVFNLSSKIARPH